MKIVQLLPRLDEGGVERGVVELSRELVKRGHESIVISCGGKLVDTLIADGAIHYELNVCSKNPFDIYKRVKSLKAKLKEIKPDILHVRSRVPAWLAYLANKELNIPVVTTVHGFNSVSFYSQIMSKGDRVICVSGAIKEYIQKHYNTPDDKITIIPRGIDLDRFNPSKVDKAFVDEFKAKYDLDGKFVVSVVGRITQLKDIETFIKSISLLKVARDDVVGLVVGGVQKGKEDYFDTLKALVRELEVEKHIIFTGSQDRIEQIYALSDVVVSSSKKPESFGRSVAEAIAMNTPVVATNHGGVLDIIQDDVNGYFYNVGDEEELLQAILKAKDLKFDGYEYISKNFTLEQMVDKTFGVYEELV